jgi:signal transduction histidine kinase
MTSERAAMLEHKPLKTQFAVSFAAIMAFSLLATIATYVAGFLLFVQLENKTVYPANYYEKQIPAIEAEVRKLGAVVLQSGQKAALERLIPEKGISYQVMLADGGPVYGTDSRRLVADRDAFYRMMNTSFRKDGTYTRLVPVIEADGTIAGGVALTYTLTPQPVRESDRVWLVPLFVAVALSPFLYIALFTLLISRRLAAGIGKPLRLLMDAARKVKEQDLDFEIRYRADNELGKLCAGFEEMKNRLKESLMAQWRSEQERQEEVAALAHDLKTPLASILGYVDSLLEHEDLDRNQRETYLHVIRKNAEKSSELVRDMLYAAELEQADVGLDAAPVDLRAWLEQKRQSYEGMAKPKRIRLEANVGPDDGPAVCMLDAGKLERILDNIVSNSIRHTPEGGTVAIRAEIGPDRVRFTVRDTGEGFRGQDLNRLFRRFYRGDAARSSRNGHAGLGLYIAKKLVELHGGRIAASQAEGGGALVEFEIEVKEK